MGIIFDQTVKGGGYPVALTEAHEQAVVREADRLYFYQMLAAEQGITTSSRKYVSKQLVRV